MYIFYVSFKKYLCFMYLVVLGSSYSMWDLVPWPGIKPWPPEWSQPLDHHREVPM